MRRSSDALADAVSRDDLHLPPAGGVWRAPHHGPPRESYDQHLISAELDIDPAPAELRWLQDVFGNSVAIATFDRRAKRLVIDSRVRVEHSPAELEVVISRNTPASIRSPTPRRRCPTCLRSIERQHHDPQRQIDGWARRFVDPSGQTDTLAMLSEMTAAIKREFTYVSRPEKGTQTRSRRSTGARAPAATMRC